MKTDNNDKTFNNNDFIKEYFPNSREITISVLVPNYYTPIDIYNELIWKARRLLESMINE
jgi:hypothetical protein